MEQRKDWSMLLCQAIRLLFLHLDPYCTCPQQRWWSLWPWGRNHCWKRNVFGFFFSWTVVLPYEWSRQLYLFHWNTYILYITILYIIFFQVINKLHRTDSHFIELGCTRQWRNTFIHIRNRGLAHLVSSMTVVLVVMVLVSVGLINKRMNENHRLCLHKRNHGIQKAA